MLHFFKAKKINFIELYKKGQDFVLDFSPIRKRKKTEAFFKILRYFCLGAIILFFIMLVLAAVCIAGLQGSVTDALAGKKNLEQAAALIKSQNFNDASDYAEAAGNDFHSASLKMRRMESGFLIDKLPIIKSQFNEAEYLLASGEILSKTVKESSVFGENLKSISGGGKALNFTQLSKEQKKSVLGAIYQSTPELSGIKANLDLTLLYLDNVKCKGLLWPIKGKINGIRNQLIFGRDILRQAIPMAQILPRIAGYPQKSSYLVLLQNNDELRPTGGFLGTYAIMETEYGEIIRMDTHDIYHIDMPVKDKITVAPPEPLNKYMGLKKWYMRDANWSPDWPVSARKIEWFFQQEDKLLPLKDQDNNINGNFDGIIAITPEFITSLLKITGPIVVDGEAYNENNFTDLLQYKVERGYIQEGVPSWHRKEVIGEIAKELKIRLFDLPPERWNEAAGAMQNNIARKNILVYLKNNDLENLVKEQDWAGEVKKATGDYLMVVDANMASLKTDNVISRGIEYKVGQSANGMFADLAVNYAHQGGYDWKTSDYHTYTRVYVPLGSRLVKAEGMEGDTVAQNELGKTVFGFFLTIKSGKIASVKLQYVLPDNVNKAAEKGKYELYVQKQPGNKVKSLKVDLNLANSVKSYSPTGFYANQPSDDRVVWEGDLGMDKRYTVNF